MINSWLANVVTESLSRPVALALAGRCGGNFCTGPGASRWNAGCFLAWSALHLDDRSWKSRGSRKTVLPPGISGWAGDAGGMDLPRDCRAAITWIHESRISGDVAGILSRAIRSLRGRQSIPQVSHS